MVLRTITTHLVNRRVAKRLTRMIPHPGVRAVASLAASVVVPVLVERVLARGLSRRGWLRVTGQPVAAKSSS